jgi:ubiquinone/menaquinone biosynthesis C-methylase UbiE
MLQYSTKPVKQLSHSSLIIPSFSTESDQNIDKETVESFGEEWIKFSRHNQSDIEVAGSQYFDIVTDEMLNHNSIVLDVGCGTGRWSKYIAHKVKHIEAIDPSRAVDAAAELTKNISHISITQAGVDNIPFEDESFDFVFSLGVMHHIPDTEAALQKAVKKLQKGGFFLIYLYYSLDNKSRLYKLLFKVSNVFRMFMSILHHTIKQLVCDVMVMIVYMPLVTLSRLIKFVSPKKRWYQAIPLSYYVDKNFKIIRNDALDRFGTPLEKRFSKQEIYEMMKWAGLDEVKFSDHAPFWHSVGKRI